MFSFITVVIVRTSLPAFRLFPIQNPRCYSKHICDSECCYPEHSRVTRLLLSTTHFLLFDLILWGCYFAHICVYGVPGFDPEPPIFLFCCYPAHSWAEILLFPAQLTPHFCSCYLVHIVKTKIFYVVANRLLALLFFAHFCCYWEHTLPIYAKK